MATFIIVIGVIILIALIANSTTPEKQVAMISEYFEKALLEHNRGNFKESINILDQAIYLFPKHPQLYNNRGESKYALEDYQGALVDFEKSLVIEPASHKNWNAHVYRQSCLDALAFAPLISSRSINEFKEQLQSQQKKADDHLASFNPGRNKKTQHENSGAKNLDKDLTALYSTYLTQGKALNEKINEGEAILESSSKLRMQLEAQEEEALLDNKRKRMEQRERQAALLRSRSLVYCPIPSTELKAGIKSPEPVYNRRARPKKQDESEPQ